MVLQSHLLSFELALHVLACLVHERVKDVFQGKLVLLCRLEERPETATVVAARLQLVLDIRKLVVEHRDSRRLDTQLVLNVLTFGVQRMFCNAAVLFISAREGPDSRVDLVETGLGDTALRLHFLDGRAPATHAKADGQQDVELLLDVLASARR